MSDIGLLACPPANGQCGVPGLRQILIAKYRSRDGIESGPECMSEAYPEGIPGEKDGLIGYEAEKPQIMQIMQSWPTGGLLASGDTQFDEKLRHLAAKLNESYRLE